MATVTPIAEDNKDKKPEDMRATGFFDLFKYASTSDVVFASVGAFAALSAGATQPLLMVLFGDLTDAASLDTNIMDTITPLVFSMLYVACAAAVMYFFAYWTLPRSAANIASSLRRQYFKSVLRSELAEFDQKMAGAVVIDINEKVHDIEKALSLKLAELLTASAQAVLGLVFAFYFCWELALVVLALVPLLVVSTFAMYKSGFGQDQMLGYASTSICPFFLLHNLELVFYLMLLLIIFFSLAVSLSTFLSILRS
jgi:ATP-binding cassette subfamily B (MDR/TAP) protein 1